MPKSTPTALPDFLNALSRRCEGDIRHDQLTRTLYSTDASLYQVMPHAVLLPKRIDDVEAAIQLAKQYKVPVLARTAGSSLAGQAVNEALVIDFTPYLDQVLELNREEKWVRVQPGIVLDELNHFLQPHGLQFGPDPASSNRAAMGGIVSNNSTGAHSILYGMTADHVLECRGFLDDGSNFHFRGLDNEQQRYAASLSGRQSEILRQFSALTEAKNNRQIIRAGTPRHWRRCGGYNLDRFVGKGPSFRIAQQSAFNPAQLICGAEGTLAVMSEIKLNLVDRPGHSALALLHFDTLHQALSAVPFILESQPAAIELLDNLALTLCKDVPAYARLLKTFISGDPFCVLITEFYADSQVQLRDKLQIFEQRLKKSGMPCSLTLATDRQLQNNVWTVRKVGLGLLMSIKGDHKPIPFIEDAAVPPEHLADYIQQVEKFCNNLGTDVAYYAHASAGCLHVRPLINTKLATDIGKLPQIARFSAELLGNYGGALSSEHGDGRCRSWLNPIFFGRDLYDLFCQTKKIFDPDNLLNPGNIVDGGEMTANLRYGSDYRFDSLKTALDFSSEKGFDRAIEMCNGAAICRKKTTGTMCPSFMVTGEERHSTRGRANALRAALSGKLPPGTLTGREMFETMALCISCKACKAECPSSVDMARIKTEFLAQYYRRNGVPWRTRLFGQIDRLNRFAAGRLAPLANSVIRSAVGKSLLSAAGFSRQRSMPEFSRQTFRQWMASHAAPAATARGDVVLFADTFSNSNHPQVAIAATKLLESLGYRVIVPEFRCCGRPQISKGLVDQARSLAGDTVNKLFPYVQQGLKIVGLEPSCLLGLRDEYLYLLPEPQKVEQLAAASLMLEEFLVAEIENGLQVPKNGAGGEILLHGHCHQKALVGTKSTVSVLRKFGYTVTEIDSSCCGMAGSFGYESEHYAISMQMAERRLLPAVRAASPQTLIVAPGTSCRHQIADGAGRSALHPAEAMWMAIDGRGN